MEPKQSGWKWSVSGLYLERGLWWVVSRDSDEYVVREKWYWKMLFWKNTEKTTPQKKLDTNQLQAFGELKLSSWEDINVVHRNGKIPEG